MIEDEEIITKSKNKMGGYFLSIKQHGSPACLQDMETI